MEKVYCKNKSCKYCRLDDMSCTYRHSLILNEKGECETFEYWLAKELTPNQAMHSDGKNQSNSQDWTEEDELAETEGLYER